MKKTIVSLTVLGLTGLLSSCNTSAPPQASDQPTVLTIPGKLASPSGPGSVSVPGVAGQGAATAADGSFTLTLPQASALTGLTLTADQVMSGLKCSGQLTSSDPAARGYLVGALNAQDGAGTRSVYAVNGSKTGLLSRSVTGKAWLYADRPTTLSGQVDCAALLGLPVIKTLPVTVAVNAKQGWNVVDLNLGASADLFANVSASGTAVNSKSSDAATVWRTLTELQAQVGF